MNGQPSTTAGFDAVIGNPPWEMLRGERGGNHDSAALTAFTRSSGVYAWQGNGHANLFQLFLERAVRLTRRGGRLAIVLPSGFAIDHGCADLRRALVDSNSIDTFVSVENRDGLFPIHRGLKILLMTATRGGHTAVLPCRSGVRSPEGLDELPDSGDPGAVPLPRAVIQAFTGDQLVIPEVRSSLDVAILSRCALCLPALCGPEGWNVAFGRELNATDDREHFVAATPVSRDLPIVEGKQVQPFRVDVGASRWRIPRETATRLLGGAAPFNRPGLVYRDVASSTNRLTLIAAIVPGDVVTTHTLFRVKGAVDIDIQWFLCGIFNSFVANYLVRTRVGTHVMVSIIERLPVPKPSTRSRAFGEVVALSRGLAADPADVAAAARLQARAARLYDMTQPEFQHVLDSFPLIAMADRAAAMREFMLLMNDPSAMG
jgi:hypothetical protein